ncbi:cysteine hydrolase family protein [Zongyangia hominis]|uniref:Cysteine hydrolase n=1 Tax=Zongyangia hominis TaxID=2763677 RepID=A0A926EEV6_9FIRM|nr:isochorismatase family cysteine hydrolase [Zongyangia hominis]MBC8570879.1 cysteine hydrolase [Zongyangia hominis]
MKKALIVVDYQNDFVTGSLGFSGAEKLEGPICEKIEQYRGEGGDVIFTFDTHGEDYSVTQEGRKLPVPHCLKGSDGWELFGRVAACREAGDRSFDKATFGSLELAEYVRGKGYDRIELCGLVSNICVLSNAVLCKAALPEADIVVDARCTASGNGELHQKTLDVLEGVQVTVLGRQEETK